MRPSYNPGTNVTLDVDRWCGLALMVDRFDHDLAEYILDEIANKKDDHTIFGMTMAELAPLRVELFFTLQAINAAIYECQGQAKAVKHHLGHVCKENEDSQEQKQSDS